MTWWKKIVQMCLKKRSIGIAVLVTSIMLGVVGAGGGYWWYLHDQQKQAAYAFVGAIADYEKSGARSAKQSLETIVDLQQAFLAGSMKYASTSFAPFYQAFAAEMQLLQGMPTEALETLEQAVSHLSAPSPFYYLYATKAALLQMDSSHEALQKQGAQRLQELATNPNNPHHAMAHYYQGYYALIAGNTAEAKNIWTQLVHNEEKRSEWGQLAQSQLALLVM